MRQDKVLVAELLDSLRYRADMVIVNPFGERVWLKSTDNGKALTDCCHADSPCAHHERLTHQASATEQ